MDTLTKAVHRDIKTRAQIARYLAEANSRNMLTERRNNTRSDSRMNTYPLDNVRWVPNTK